MAKLQCQEVQDTSLCLDATRGGRDETDKFNDVFEELEDTADRLLKRLKRQRMKVHQDLSVKQALAQEGWNAGGDPVKNVVEWNLWDAEYGGEIERLSTFHNVFEEFSKEDFGKKEMYVCDQRGFNEVFKVMADELNAICQTYRNTVASPLEDNGPKGIFLNHRVTNINYWEN